MLVPLFYEHFLVMITCESVCLYLNKESAKNRSFRCNSVTVSPVKHCCTLVCNNQSRMIFLYEIKYFYVLQSSCLYASVTNFGNVVADGSPNIF